jgi:hypothetical protein
MSCNLLSDWMKHESLSILEESVRFLLVAEREKTLSIYWRLKIHANLVYLVESVKDACL